MNNNLNNKLLSIGLPSYYSQENIPIVYKKIKKRMESEGIPFELLIVDDGSKDDSYKVACSLENNDERVRAYQLSRNFTTHYVKFAILKLCRGGCQISIPDDLQIPIDLVVKMYRHWESGNKIVVPFREKRNDGLLNDFFSNLYYKVMNKFSDVSFPPGGADTFLIDREIIEIFNNYIHPINTNITVELLRLGFDPIYIPFKRPSVQSRSRWTLNKKLRLAIDSIFSSSSFPIKMITFVGVVSVVLAFILILLSVIIKLTTETGFLGFSIPGWTTNFILISFFSGLILFSLGVIAEYIWRIYEEVKGRPGYIIRKKDKNYRHEEKRKEKSKEKREKVSRG